MGEDQPAAEEKGDERSPGSICALKFPLFYENQDEGRKDQLEEEAALWRTIWGASDVRVVTLCEKPVLIMPYLKMCKGGVKDQSDKQAVKDAIQKMVKAGYKHNECRWEAKAVLIDLGNVDQISTEEGRRRRERDVQEAGAS